MELQRPVVHAPPFPPAAWINTGSPLTLAGLRGRVVLLNIWDFTCINCLRTLPYLRAWHERYEDCGLTLIGAHTPEFTFARGRKHVEAAARRLGVRWPVILDNDQAVWTAYANRYWPTVYLLDASGYVRYRHIGDRGYAQVERAIQALLLEIHPDLDLPATVGTLRPEDAPGAVCYPTTPELHVDSVGNTPRPMNLPLLLKTPSTRAENQFYLEGTWRIVDDGVALCATGGSVTLPYAAASVNAVLSPHPDPLAIDLQLEPPVEVDLSLDDAPFPSGHLGEDAYLAGGGARLRVDSPRMYRLVRHADLERHELRLTGLAQGLTLYAFSFGTCLAPSPRPG